MRLYTRGVPRFRYGWQTPRSYKDRWIKRSNVNEFEVSKFRTLRNRLVALARPPLVLSPPGPPPNKIKHLEGLLTAMATVIGDSWLGHCRAATYSCPSRQSPGS